VRHRGVSSAAVVMARTIANSGPGVERRRVQAPRSSGVQIGSKVYPIPSICCGIAESGRPID